MTRLARPLSALLLACAMVAALSAAAPQRALASASCAVQTKGKLQIDGQYVTQVMAPLTGGTCASQVVAHSCVNMGASGGVSAIECADIDMTWNSSALEVWGGGEYYCQGSSGYVRCAAMSVDQVFYWDANTTVQGVYGHPGGNYVCSGSSCPGGSTQDTGRAWVSTYHYSGSQSTAQENCTFPIIAKAESSNLITVPDGVTMATAPPAATPLISVCFFPS